MMGNSLGGAAMSGLGMGQLQTGIARTSRLPVQRRPGAPSEEEGDIEDFLEIADDGMYDEMMAMVPSFGEDDDYGVAPKLMRSRFIENYGQTSAQPLQPRMGGGGMMGGGMGMGGAAMRGLQF